jgi:DNA-binding transcriptional LysR family regulator
LSRRKPARVPPLRLTLRQLQIFTAIAQAGSTTAAADRLALSQSATSAALKEVESLLGGPLFDRVGRGLVLNENGRSMLPQALAVVEAAQGIEDQFGSAARNVAPRLRLAASTTTGNYLLPRLIAAYRRKVPAAAFNLEIGNSQHVTRTVADFEVDLGFIEGPTTDSRLKVIPWVRDELVVVCSPRHPLAHGLKRGLRAKVPIARLREETWLLRERGSGTREVAEAALLPHLRRIRTDIELGSTEAIKTAAAEGLGLTCLSRHAVGDLLDLGRLAVLATQLPPMRRMLYLIHHERRYLTPALERFIAFCLATYRRRR